MYYFLAPIKKWKVAYYDDCIFWNRDKRLILQNFAKIYVWSEQNQCGNNRFLPNKFAWKKKKRETSFSKFKPKAVKIDV